MLNAVALYRTFSGRPYRIARAVSPCGTGSSGCTRQLQDLPTSRPRYAALPSRSARAADHRRAGRSCGVAVEAGCRARCNWTRRTPAGSVMATCCSVGAGGRPPCPRRFLELGQRNREAVSLAFLRQRAFAGADGSVLKQSRHRGRAATASRNHRPEQRAPAVRASASSTVQTARSRPRSSLARCHRPKPRYLFPTALTVRKVVVHHGLRGPA